VSSRIAALVLAAGTSSRMEGRNKLLCEVGGMTMIERTVRAALDSRCTQVVVVTGWQAQQVEAALDSLVESRPVMVVRNPQYATGLSSSLRCAVATLPETLDAALVLLADMPWIGAAHIDRVIEAFDPRAPAIIAPFRGGQRGHPVLWPKAYLPMLGALGGDVGARWLLERFADQVRAVPFDDAAVVEDIDTQQQLAEAQRR
jgi:molybdenum cofactor cytidylyltransferase